MLYAHTNYKRIFVTLWTVREVASSNPVTVPFCILFIFYATSSHVNMTSFVNVCDAKGAEILYVKL